MATNKQDIIDAHKPEQTIPRAQGTQAQKPTDKLLASQKYPARKHAQKVVGYLREHLAAGAGDVDEADIGNGLLYLEATRTRYIEDSDMTVPFRQRRYFYYLTGCELADAAVIWDVKKEQSTLFIPGVDADDVVWSGLPMSPEEALKKYEVDHVRTTEELDSFLKEAADSDKRTIFAVDKQISDHVKLSAFSKTETKLLKTAIEECRVTKDEYEIALIRKANEVSDLAHQAVMKQVSQAGNEQELLATFHERCTANGCHKQAYGSIVAAGTDAATLHYVKNDKAISPTHLNLLLDAGGEYNMYASDITRTFPIHGQFSRGSAAIYKLVLKMQKTCISRLIAGVDWDEIHELAHKVAIEGLLELGLLRGRAEDILKARTSVAFFPHGLGHYLGMDTHDTGGHANYSDPDPMFRFLRVRGKLPAGSVITVEPGIYFCRFIIEPYLKDEKHAQYINADLLEGYWQVGGVRIEDNVLVTAEGHENLTIVPKEVEEIESLVNATAKDQVSEYPPAVQ